MKRAFVVTLGGLLLLCSCGSYTATGAYTGAQFGNVIGSAIGGISGGWRGHHEGSLIGTIGGAVAGAAIGAVVDNAQQKKMQERAGSGDDRIVFEEGSGYPPEREVSVNSLVRKAPVEVRNARIADKSGDGVLTRGEECTVSFEIMNNSDRVVYDLCPIVEDVTGNKHVNISPNLLIESINPHQGVRYTATILADKRLKDGEIVVRLGIRLGQDTVVSQTREIKVPTKKKI